MMAFIRVIAVALALASTTAWSSHPSESAGNQYRVREDSPQLQLLTEATVHRPKVIEDSTPNPDLQVGCGEGHIHEAVHDTDKNTIQKAKSSRLGKIKSRRRRSFTPWSGEVAYPSYQSIAVWKPPMFQLSRPYYIPIYGVDGKVKIFFPPQPLRHNPGYPRDNPYSGPTYLPATTGKTSTVRTRFGEDPATPRPSFNGGDNEEDRPVWDMGGGQPTTTTYRPTRKTLPPGVTKPTPPPLVHKDTSSKNTQKESPPLEPGATQPTPVAEQDKNSPAPARPREPSKCVWAIISCCSTNEVRLDCFEQRGCNGPFWDGNPCDSEFARAALNTALNFYQ